MIGNPPLKTGTQIIYLDDFDQEFRKFIGFFREFLGLIQPNWIIAK